MKRWLPLVALATAQFVMVLDQSVMNVSISQLVEDFDTTVTTIQAVITLYCLVMAMLMLTGGKIGDIIGRRKAFVIGLIIYACGSAMTAAAPTVAVLTLGWSILEGIGAALVLPAMAALIAGNFEGESRKGAYADHRRGRRRRHRRRPHPRRLGHDGAELAGHLPRRGRPRRVHPAHDPLRRRHADHGRQAPPRRRRLGPGGQRAGTGRPGHPAIEHLGLVGTEGLAVRAVRLLRHPVRDRLRGRPLVGLRALAAPARDVRARIRWSTSRC